MQARTSAWLCAPTNACWKLLRNSVDTSIFPMENKWLRFWPVHARIKHTCNLAWVHGCENLPIHIRNSLTFRQKPQFSKIDHRRLSQGPVQQRIQHTNMGASFHAPLRQVHVKKIPHSPIEN